MQQKLQKQFRKTKNVFDNAGQNRSTLKSSYFRNNPITIDKQRTKMVESIAIIFTFILCYNQSQKLQKNLLFLMFREKNTDIDV